MLDVHADLVAGRTETDPSDDSGNGDPASPAETMGNAHDRSISDGSDTETGDTASRSGGGSLDNEEPLEKVPNVSNGETFERLWNGNRTGYESHPEADMALCFPLAFWIGPGSIGSSASRGWCARSGTKFTMETDRRTVRRRPSGRLRTFPTTRSG